MKYATIIFLALALCACNPEKPKNNMLRGGNDPFNVSTPDSPASAPKQQPQKKQ